MNIHITVSNTRYCISVILQLSYTHVMPTSVRGLFYYITSGFFLFFRIFKRPSVTAINFVKSKTSSATPDTKRVTMTHAICHNTRL